MKLFEKYKYQISNPEDTLQKEKLNKSKYFEIFNVVLWFFIGIKLVFEIVYAESFFVYTSIASLLALLINFYIGKKVKSLKAGIYIMLGVVIIYSCISVIYGELLTVSIVLTALFPIMSLTFFGLKKGTLYNGILLVLISIFLYLPENEIIYADYSLKNKSLFIFSYLIFSTVFYLYQIIKNSEYSELEKTMLKEVNNNKEKTDFINSLSHQLRTPLNNIMVITNIVTNTELDEKQKDLIDTIYASTNNLVDVVENMVNLSASSISQPELKFNFNLKKTISNTIKLYSSQHSNLKFNIKISKDIPEYFVGDPVKIKQIFLNLIENILKNKIQDSIEIMVSVSKIKQQDGDFHLNFVLNCDSTLHIPTTNVNQFITSEKPREEKSPIYIDLFDLKISKKIIELNGGSLNIDVSQQEAVFSFPYVLEMTKEIFNDEQSEKGTELKEKEPVNRESISKPKIELKNANILLVEDNLINQKIVVLSLKSHVKNIDIANNGKEALDKFGTSRYDIILMDIQMPIMNGITSTKKIREIEKSIGTHTPIIAITANALLGDKEECINAGMDEYISKPFQIEVLIQKMNALLSK